MGAVRRIISHRAEGWVILELEKFFSYLERSFLDLCLRS